MFLFCCFISNFINSFPHIFKHIFIKLIRHVYEGDTPIIDTPVLICMSKHNTVTILAPLLPLPLKFLEQIYGRRRELSWVGSYTSSVYAPSSPRVWPSSSWPLLELTTGVPTPSSHRCWLWIIIPSFNPLIHDMWRLRTWDVTLIFHFAEKYLRINKIVNNKYTKKYPVILSKTHEQSLASCTVV